ncbi:hypothetical protein FXO37_25638 [Capsicum annuum]|nr:hypothetical protein FXO37_25638 [Capsicum annuum]
MEQVEGPKDNVVKVGTFISGDSVEPGHSQPLNLAGRGPRVVVFPNRPLLPHLHQLLVVLQQGRGAHGVGHGDTLQTWKVPKSANNKLVLTIQPEDQQKQAPKREEHEIN